MSNPSRYKILFRTLFHELHHKVKYFSFFSANQQINYPHSRRSPPYGHRQQLPPAQVEDGRPVRHDVRGAEGSGGLRAGATHRSQGKGKEIVGTATERATMNGRSTVLEHKKED